MGFQLLIVFLIILVSEGHSFQVWKAVRSQVKTAGLAGFEPRLCVPGAVCSNCTSFSKSKNRLSFRTSGPVLSMPILSSEWTYAIKLQHSGFPFQSAGSCSSFFSMMISSVLYSSTNPCFRKSVIAGLSMAMSSYRIVTPFFFAASHSRSRPLPP